MSQAFSGILNFFMVQPRSRKISYIQNKGVDSVTIDPHDLMYSTNLKELFMNGTIIDCDSMDGEFSD